MAGLAADFGSTAPLPVSELQKISIVASDYRQSFEVLGAEINAIDDEDFIESEERAAPQMSLAPWRSGSADPETLMQFAQRCRTDSELGVRSSIRFRPTARQSTGFSIAPTRRSDKTKITAASTRSKGRETPRYAAQKQPSTPGCMPVARRHIVTVVDQIWRQAYEILHGDMFFKVMALEVCAAVLIASLSNSSFCDCAEPPYKARRANQLTAECKTDAEEFGLVSGGLAFFLFFLVSFRAQRCYDRWWEARCAWGKTTTACRSLTQQASSAFPRLHGAKADEEVDNAVALMSRLVIVYAYALKDRLHDRPLDIHDLAGMIDPEALHYLTELDGPSVSIHLIEQMRWLIAEQFAGPRAQGVATLCRSAAFETAAMGDMLHTVGTIHSCLGACLRVKSSPLPHMIRSYMQVFTLVYCLLLAVQLLCRSGWYTLVPVGLFGWILIGVQHAADRMERPFQQGAVDSLKLDGFCKIIKSQNLKISSRHRHAWRFSGGHDHDCRLSHLGDSVQADFAPTVSPNPQTPLPGGIFRDIDRQEAPDADADADAEGFRSGLADELAGGVAGEVVESELIGTVDRSIYLVETVDRASLTDPIVGSITGV